MNKTDLTTLTAVLEILTDLQGAYNYYDGEKQGYEYKLISEFRHIVEREKLMYYCRN